METPRRLLRSSFARFLAGGIVTYATTLAVLALWMRGVGLNSFAAYACTHVTVLAVGFALNRLWVFRARADSKAAQGARFVAANLLFRFVDWCVYSAIALLLAPPAFLNVMAANALVLPAKYLWYRHQVFPADRPDRRALSERTT